MGVIAPTPVTPTLKRLLAPLRLGIAFISVSHTLKRNRCDQVKFCIALDK